MASHETLIINEANGRIASAGAGVKIPVGRFREKSILFTVAGAANQSTPRSFTAGAVTNGLPSGPPGGRPTCNGM